MAKYDPLFRHLCTAGDGPVELTFAEIEGLVGALPASARRSPAWWRDAGAETTNPQARAWLNAGRRVERIDLSQQVVRFSAAGWLRGS